jgi:preprotein translocase subunit SecG
MIEQLVLVVHLLLALSIIGLIMLQQGKGAEMGASFGAGASQTLFGSSGGTNVLTRATAWLVALFFATSFGLAVIAKGKLQDPAVLGIAVPATSQLPEADGELPEAPETGAAEAQPLGDLPVLDAEVSAQGSDLPEQEPEQLRDELPEQLPE